MRCRNFLVLSIAATLVSFCQLAQAEDPVWATGMVVSADGKKPLAGAIVAVYDDRGKVIDYSKTGDDGTYSLTVPRGVLHLDHHSPGFLHQVFSGVGRVVGGIAGPLKYGVRAAASAAQLGDPVTKAGVGAASGIAQNILDTMRPSGKKKLAPAPGTVLIKVTRPGCNDAVDWGSVYWMQEEIQQEGRKQRKGMAAWLDPACLTAAGSDEASKIESDYLTFTDARLEPSIAEPGQMVKLTVEMPAPPDPSAPAVVVAKNSKTGKLIDLNPIGRGRYQAELKIDKKYPKNDQTITIIAFADQSDFPGKNKKVQNSLNGAGYWDPAKPYVYNPLFVVSRNRAEVTLTVVEPKKSRR